ncbi:hypothetical protein EPN28_04370 [Patescibacteria group bacterium]|nr:MAG: hypothetical protein EPN28_04370 [Patescibacteria group bacterium]
MKALFIAMLALGAGGCHLLFGYNPAASVDAQADKNRLDSGIDAAVADSWQDSAASVEGGMPDMAADAFTPKREAGRELGADLGPDKGTPDTKPTHDTKPLPDKPAPDKKPPPDSIVVKPDVQPAQGSEGARCYNCLPSGKCSGNNSFCNKGLHCVSGACAKVACSLPTTPCVNYYVGCTQVGCVNGFCTWTSIAGSCGSCPDFCDDGNACTTNECIPSIGCKNNPIPGCT